VVVGHIGLNCDRRGHGCHSIALRKMHTGTSGVSERPRKIQTAEQIRHETTPQAYGTDCGRLHISGALASISKRLGVG